ncbi:hypothetical protein ACFSO7_08490 [Bacillus sp. CGMCC 1.16607]|uniref:hypothetical protein n=1 Tax=Bacillus sp. CGMCC 1.16607 TaxID=3351842 RepID=UPI0036406DB3
MTVSSFIRFTGFCSIIAGILTVSLSLWYNISMEAFGSYVSLISMLFLVLGIVGLYLYQAKEFGSIGFAIFLLTFFGAIMWAGHSWVEAFMISILEETAPAIIENPPSLLMTGVTLSLYPFFIGLLLFGLWTVIKGVLPRIPAIILIIVPIIDFIPYGFHISQPLAGVAITWLGYSIWKSSKSLNS